MHQALVTVREMAARDPEQEVEGLAVPVLDAVVSAAREHVLLDDPVLDVLPDLISPFTIGEGKLIRAVDAQLVLAQLKLALDRAIESTIDEPLQFRPEPGPFD